METAIHLDSLNHKLGFLPIEGVALDKSPLSIKLRVGVRDKVKTIPDWNTKLRDLIEQWIVSELYQDE